MKSNQPTRVTGEERTPEARAFDRVRPADLAWLAIFVVFFGILLARNYWLGQTQLTDWHLGPITLRPFGLLAALDIAFCYYLIYRWCARFGLDWETLVGGLFWIAVIGFCVSHLVSIAFYTPERLTDLKVLFSPWLGISSFGGILGGGLASSIFLKRKGLSVWLYNDALLYGFIGGYIFGRLGCFAVHDHPGVHTGFFLGVDVRGAVRHDLGLYLMLVMIALFLALNWMARRGLPPAGSVVALVAIPYAPIRFYLDSLRIDDPTYLGFTPGQWFCFPTLVLGLWALSVARKGRQSPYPKEQPVS